MKEAAMSSLWHLMVAEGGGRNSFLRTIRASVGEYPLCGIAVSEIMATALELAAEQQHCNHDNGSIRNQLLGLTKLLEGFARSEAVVPGIIRLKALHDIALLSAPWHGNSPTIHKPAIAEAVFMIGLGGTNVGSSDQQGMSLLKALINNLRMMGGVEARVDEPRFRANLATLGELHAPQLPEHMWWLARELQRSKRNKDAAQLLELLGDEQRTYMQKPGWLLAQQLRAELAKDAT